MADHADIFRLAFVGGSGHHYLRGLLRDPDSASRYETALAGDGCDDEATRAYAEKLNSPTWFDSCRDMLERFRPDVLSVGAVYGLNSRFATEALQRGIPVVSDKPIAASWDELRRLAELAGKPGAKLITEFDFRSEAPFRAAHHAVAEGVIGDVVLATAQKSYRFGSRPKWYADRKLYGGTILWVASHAIDVIPFVTGLPIANVTARQGNLSRPDYGTMEDHCALLFELDRGATGIVHADFLRPKAAPTHGDDRLRVAGTRGVVEVRAERCILTTRDRGETDITDHVPVRPVHEELFEAACGAGSDYYSTDHSITTAAVLLACRDAADQQTTIDIQQHLAEHRLTGVPSTT